MAVGVGDICRVTVEGEGDSGQDVQTVFHIKNSGVSVDESDALDDLTEIIEVLYALFGTVLSVLYRLNAVRAVNVTDATDIGVKAPVQPFPGTGVGGPLPPQCALGLTLTTTALTSLGRKFFGLPDEAQIGTEGELNATALANMADVGDHMTEEQNAVNSDWQYGLIQTIGGAFLPFQNFTVTSTIVTQRRRRRGVGT